VVGILTSCGGWIARTELPVPTPEDLSRQLRDLHDAYVDKVNRLVAEGREDLIQELVDAYSDEALAAMTAAPSL
jgi:hypothetical protein